MRALKIMWHLEQHGARKEIVKLLRVMFVCNPSNGHRLRAKSAPTNTALILGFACYEATRTGLAKRVDLVLLATPMSSSTFSMLLPRACRGNSACACLYVPTACGPDTSIHSKFLSNSHYEAIKDVRGIARLLRKSSEYRNILMNATTRRPSIFQLRSRTIGIAP